VIAWVNMICLLLAILGVLYFCVRSAGPAALEQKIGPSAYQRCANYRLIEGGLMGVTMLNYILYVFYPLPIPLPKTFPWSH